MQKNLTKLSNTKTKADFTSQLLDYKNTIDSALNQHINILESNTAEQFGGYPLEAVQAFTSVLARGGKRIRGSLAIEAYKMLGGTNKQLIIQAACALEILNTYILVADDIQDRSESRRGGKTAHILIKEAHQKRHFSGDPQHFGEAIAINSFLVAQSYAINVLAGLDADPKAKLKAILNVNNSFIATAHGQTLDIYNEAVANVTEQDVMNVLEWKTAYYTFVNPLQLGAILAGADDIELSNLLEFGRYAGITFQVTDDILGLFSTEQQSGKSPLDDIKEGKRTLLIVYALKNAPKADAYFLEQCLGNQDLTMAEFDKCKQIVIDCGALVYARNKAEHSAKAAIDVIVKNTKWPKKSKQFLTNLVQYLLVRKS